MAIFIRIFIELRHKIFKQTLLTNNSNFFDKQKRKQKSNIHKGLKFTKTMGLRVMNLEKNLQTMGLKVREKNLFIFLSLRLQKCMMIIFFRKIVWVYEYHAH